MIAFYVYTVLVIMYWVCIYSEQQWGLINFKPYAVLKGVSKKIFETYLKNEKVKITISLIVNIVLKLSLAILLNAIVDGIVLKILGIKEDNKLTVMIVMSLISIVIDYVLLINLERDLDKKEHAISKNFIDALMQLGFVITLIAGLINIKQSPNSESALVFILYVFPALISYKYQLKVFDKDNENKED